MQNDGSQREWLGSMSMCNEVRFTGGYDSLCHGPIKTRVDPTECIMLVIIVEQLRIVCIDRHGCIAFPVSCFL